MPRSQPPTESPDKDVDSETLHRFSVLAKRLFNVDLGEFRDVQQKDEEERRARREGRPRRGAPKAVDDKAPKGAARPD